jgi:antitoxin PrlF
MILSRISSKAQTTIPRAVRAALGLKQGDQIAYRIEDGRVVLTRAAPADPFDDPFAGFTEWAGEADRVYDQLAARFPSKADRPA